MRGDEMKRRLNRVKTRTGQRDLRRDGVLNQDTKRTSASLLANPQRAFQQNPSEPSASLPASRRRQIETTRVGQSVKRGEPARTKAERGTGATGRTGRDLTRQTGRSQGRGEPQASSERDPGTAGRTRGQPRQTQGGVTS